MRKKTHVLSLLLACATAFGQSSYDLVIVGGNPGGIMQPSRLPDGEKSVILERTRYVADFPPTDSEQPTSPPVPQRPACSVSLWTE